MVVHESLDIFDKLVVCQWGFLNCFSLVRELSRSLVKETSCESKLDLTRRILWLFCNRPRDFLFKVGRDFAENTLFGFLQGPLVSDLSESLIICDLSGLLLASELSADSLSTCLKLSVR